MNFNMLYYDGLKYVLQALPSLHLPGSNKGNPKAPQQGQPVLRTDV